MTRRFPDLTRPKPTVPFISRIVYFILALAMILAIMVLLGPGPARAECSISMMRALAQEHSNDQARRDQMDHSGFDSRARRGARAENVAYGVSTKEKAIAMWWRSPGHAANMRLPGCRAVASAVSRSGRRYFTMEIGQ